MFETWAESKDGGFGKDTGYMGFPIELYWIFVVVLLRDLLYLWNKSGARY